MVPSVREPLVPYGARNDNRSATRMDCPVTEMDKSQLHGWTLQILPEVYDQLRVWRSGKLPNETGGMRSDGNNEFPGINIA